MISAPMHVSRSSAPTVSAIPYPSTSVAQKVKEYIKANISSGLNGGWTFDTLFKKMEKLGIDSFASRWSTLIDEAIVEAHKYGVDLTSQLSPAEIFKSMKVVIQTSDPNAYIDANYNTFISNVEKYLTKVKTDISPSKSYTDLATAAEAPYLAELKKYGINSIPTAGSLRASVTDLISKLQSEYKAYIGTLTANKFFYDKSGFTYTKAITDTINNPTTHAAIVAEVKKQMQTLFTNANKNQRVDSRDFYRALYNYKVNNQKMSLTEFEADFMEATFKTKINAFTSGGKVIFNEVRLQEIPTNDKNKIKLNIKITFSIEGMPMSINRELELPMHEYAIEGMEAIVKQYNSKSWVFGSTTNWANGQKLTELDLTSASMSGANNVDWHKLFTDLNAYVSAHTIGNDAPSFEIVYQNNAIVIKFIDPTIKSTDFDYGNDLPNFPQYVFNRHESKSTSSSGTAIGFIPQNILHYTHSVQFVSEFKDLFNKLDQVTAPGKQPHKAKVETLYKPDGSYVDLDEAILEQIFPDWKTGFDAFVTARGFKWSASITKIQHNDVGEAIVNIVLTDQKGHSMSEEITIETIDAKLFMQELRDRFNKYENTWEDNTPSKKPDGYTTPTDPSGLYVGSNAPTLSQLNSIFNAISTLNHPPVQLSVTGIQERTAISTTTAEMIMSWNENLVSRLGTSTDDLKAQINALLSALSLVGNLDRHSKYVDVNLDVVHDGKTEHFSLLAVHYLSHEQRVIESQLISIALDILAKHQLEAAFNKFNLPDNIRAEIIKLFNAEKNKIIAKANNLLKPKDANALIPDWVLSEINTGLDGLNSFIDQLKDKYNISDDNLDKLKNISKAFKYILTGIGAALGITGLIGLLIPIKTARANKKYRAQNPNVKRSSKGLIMVSTIAGVLSALASVGIMLYVFVEKGGF